MPSGVRVTVARWLAGVPGSIARVRRNQRHALLCPDALQPDVILARRLRMTRRLTNKRRARARVEGMLFWKQGRGVFVRAPSVEQPL